MEEIGTDLLKFVPLLDDAQRFQDFALFFAHDVPDLYKSGWLQLLVTSSAIPAR